MEDAGTSYDLTTSSEGTEDLNGKDASYRGAPMISSPRTVIKRRVRGALIPTGKVQ